MSEKKKYDLEERTAIFGERIIEIAKRIPKSAITSSLVNQVVRSGTSIGGNYCEADCAETKKDFVHKIGLCKKEAKETKHWLRMLIKAAPELQKEFEVLRKEAHELHLIFITIVRNSKANE